SGWDPVNDFVPLPPALEVDQGDGGRTLREVYRKLYSRLGASYEEIYDVLRPTLARRLGEVGQGPSVGDAKAGFPVLLGDHESSAQGDATRGDSALTTIVHEIVERWPSPPDPLKGRSLNELLRSERLRVRRDPSNRERLRHLIRRVAGVDGRDGVNRAA